MRTSHVLSKETAERVIEPFRPVLATAIKSAVSDWAALPTKAPEETAGMSHYTFTRYVHDRAIFRLLTAQKPGGTARPIADEGHRSAWR